MVFTGQQSPLSGRRILVASGPTRAPIDAVRYISNRSTGRLGSTIATELVRRGASVIFVYGTGSRTPDMVSPNLVLDEIETVDEAAAHITRHLTGREIFATVMALAALDYRPKEVAQGKLSSEPQERTVTLVRCQKIIDRIKTVSPETILVGFKLEAKVTQEELFARAEQLADRARCDLVVANRVDEISRDEHRAWFLLREETASRIVGPFDTPEQITFALADQLERLAERRA